MAQLTLLAVENENLSASRSALILASTATYFMPHRASTHRSQSLGLGGDNFSNEKNTSPSGRGTSMSNSPSTYAGNRSRPAALTKQLAKRLSSAWGPLIPSL